MDFPSRSPVIKLDKEIVPDILLTGIFLLEGTRPGAGKINDDILLYLSIGILSITLILFSNYGHNKTRFNLLTRTQIH